MQGSELFPSKGQRAFTFSKTGVISPALEGSAQPLAQDRRTPLPSARDLQPTDTIRVCGLLSIAAMDDLECLERRAKSRLPIYDNQTRDGPMRRSPGSRSLPEAAVLPSPLLLRKSFLSFQQHAIAGGKVCPLPLNLGSYGISVSALFFLQATSCLEIKDKS
jgi:hypothetical protein